MKLTRIIEFIFLSIATCSIGQTVNKGEFTVLDSSLLSVVDSFYNQGVLYNDGSCYIYADYQNNGDVTYVKKGTFWFIGAAIQNISGNEDSYFYDVKINLSKEKSFLNVFGDISIANKATFINGIVENKNSGGIITFEENSSALQATDMSYVQGAVKHYGSQDFNYPIGDGFRYRNIKVDGIFDNNAFLESENFRDNSSKNYPHTQKDDDIELLDFNEFWVLSNINQTTSEVIVTLTWDDEITPKKLLEDKESIKIARWNEQEKKWVNEGGTVDLINKTVTTAMVLDEKNVISLALVDDYADDLIIYNLISPSDENNKNDFLLIKGINKYPDNSLKIFNRWGAKVFDVKGYNEQNNVFRGYSEGRLTINSNKFLPTGTYFYILKYKKKRGTGTRTITKTGYLYIN